MISLSIIVPCYNEAKNIPLIFAKFLDVVKQQSDVEVVLVNNGSTDNSVQVFRDYLVKPEYSFARVVTVPTNIGYGHGIMFGLRAAHSEVLAWTHADMQTDPMDVVLAYKKFLKLNQPDHIIIKGKRIKRSLGEWGFTFGMSCIASVVLGKVLYDINAQPKLFHRSLLVKMSEAPDDFSLDLYLLYLTKKLGYRIETIPVNFGKRLYGESHWSFSFASRYKTVLRTIRYIFALKKALR